MPSLVGGTRVSSPYGTFVTLTKSKLSLLVFVPLRDHGIALIDLILILVTLLICANRKSVRLRVLAPRLRDCPLLLLALIPL